MVGPSGRAFAIEANPDNARLIALSTAPIETITLLPIALGDEVGFAEFVNAIGSNGGFADAIGSDRTSTSIVPTIPLDDLVTIARIDKIDVAKIDVEGAEPIVFRGGIEMLGRDRPVIIFEFSCEMTQRVDGTRPLDHLAMIEAMGYEISLIDRETKEIRSIGSSTELISTWGDPGRIDDFVAVPAGA